MDFRFSWEITCGGRQNCIVKVDKPRHFKADGVINLKPLYCAFSIYFLMIC